MLVLAHHAFCPSYYHGMASGKCARLSLYKDLQHKWWESMTTWRASLSTNSDSEPTIAENIRVKLQFWLQSSTTLQPMWMTADRIHLMELLQHQNNVVIAYGVRTYSTFHKYSLPRTHTIRHNSAHVAKYLSGTNQYSIQRKHKTLHKFAPPLLRNS